MKRSISLLMILILSCALCSASFAEDTEEYCDSMYSFRYPADWSLGKANNGDIVLNSPDGNDAVLTFCIISDATAFTGMATDAPTIENYIEQYDGKNLSLRGDYETVQWGELLGFRATGSWRASGQAAVMTILTGQKHLLGFIMIGDKAIALEDELIGSVTLFGTEPTEGAAGYKRWESALFSLEYPENFSATDLGTGVAFLNTEDPNNIIVARTYELEMDYSDDYAPIIASAALPKSTGITATPVMEQVGGYRAAVIRGDSDAGLIGLYVIGRGRTAVVIMFMGDGVNALADVTLASVQIY